MYEKRYLLMSNLYNITKLKYFNNKMIFYNNILIIYYKILLKK